LSPVQLVPSSVPLPPYLQSTCDTPLLLDFCLELQPVSQSPAISAAQSPPSPFSPSVPPPLSSVAPSRACQDPSPPGHEEPEAPPPASDSFELPRSVALTPALLRPSTSEWTIGLSTMQDSLGMSAPPGSDITSRPLRTYGPSVALWSSTPSTMSCSALPQALSPPSIAPTRPQTSGSPPRSQEVVTAAPSWPPGSSPSLHHLSSSAARWAPSLPSLPTVIPMAVLISTLPWLLPPSTPPWGTTLAVAWKNILQLQHKAITWMSPPSAPPWTPGFHLLPVNCSPPEPPPASAHFTITSPTSRTPSGPPL
ncbi:hypothetical protein DPX16_12756, partial [Anabarilius grahami]